MTRKKSRDNAFKLLFQMDIQKESAENILSIFYEETEIDDDAKKYIDDILFGVEKNIEQINNIIKKTSKSWEVSRISKVAVATLRLCIYEILFRADIPPTVSINEAVDLVKKYDSEESTGFVNGILATVLKEDQKG